MNGAYQEGRSAALMGEPVYANLYPTADIDHPRWLDGWYRAKASKTRGRAKGGLLDMADKYRRQAEAME